jgi:putative PIN family toxin of toxin-antitoxin system
VTAQPKRRVVFDTNVALSALLFPISRLAWLRAHWRESGAVPLVSPATVLELMRVVAYPKFGISEQYRMETLALYLPYCESLNPADKCSIECRDFKDQSLLDLAHSGKADVLVTSHEDLLALAGRTAFVIETPEAYRSRVSGVEEKP